MNLDTINKSSKESIISSLNTIAESLIKNTALQVNEKQFSFVDLEVYYWHENHQDDYTLKHKRETGELEMHRYGVDISLGNKCVGQGGILIRGLHDGKEVIQKSSVVKEIFNSFTMGDNQIRLIEKYSQWDEVFTSTRVNLGEDKQGSGFKNSQYRFLAKDKTILKGYKGKEAIFRNSNLNDEDIKDLLGYSLKK